MVGGNGKIRAIKYVANYTYIDLEGKTHWVDTKRCKTPMYRLKRQLAVLLDGTEIEKT
jgi:hypothetical protein